MNAPVRNPYSGRDFFVGRRQELNELRDYLSQGESALLIGGRRAGKTSLAERVKEIGRTVYRFDASSCSLDNEANIVRAIAALFGDDCDTRAKLTTVFKRHAPLAIMIDEADQILAERWAGSFLSYLRYLIDSELRSDLAILLIGGPALNRYANPDDKGSPPLNTARRVYLHPLAHEARRELAAPLPVAPDVHWLDTHAAGHPWLLKRLLEQLWRGQSQDDAIDNVFAEALPNFEIWKRQLGEEGRSFLRALPPEGIARTTLLRDRTWSRHRPAAILVRSMCLIDIDDRRRILPGPALFRDWLESVPEEEKWDLAISYASEDLTIAGAIATELKGDFRVFFAPDQSAYLWGDDLSRVLPHTYGANARYVLVLSSAAYVEKHWTLVEWKAALAARPDRILVMNLGTLPPEMPEGLVYRGNDPQNLITLIGDLRNKLEMA